MNRDLTLLRFILLATENVNHHVSGTCSHFTKERAISYELITLGEAVKDISADLKKNYPHIPWQLISGTRDRLAHDYEDISSKVIWDIVNAHLPELAHNIETIIKNMEEK
jgi:uncharacterized protein with HEPN domain